MAAVDLESSLGLQVLTIDFADTFCLVEEIVLNTYNLIFINLSMLVWCFFFGLMGFLCLFVTKVLHDLQKKNKRRIYCQASDLEEDSLKLCC